MLLLGLWLYRGAEVTKTYPSIVLIGQNYLRGNTSNLISGMPEAFSRPAYQWDDNKCYALTGSMTCYVVKEMVAYVRLSSLWRRFSNRSSCHRHKWNTTRVQDIWIKINEPLHTDFLYWTGMCYNFRFNFMPSKIIIDCILTRKKTICKSDARNLTSLKYIMKQWQHYLIYY